MTAIKPLDRIIGETAAVADHKPWRRAVVTEETWHAAIDALVAGELGLSSLWAEPAMVHMALLDEAAGDLAVVSLPCPDGRYPSVGAHHPPAIRLERAIRDLYGLEAVGAEDTRPWVDHGKWGVRHPLGTGPIDCIGEPPAYPFLPVEGEGLHEIPVGPVHAGIIEPGHFRFTANGETVVRLEARLGYVHKGLQSVLQGVHPVQACRPASRASGDSTVAYALAFSRAVEAALGVEVSPRAVALRALMAELERLSNHLGDIGAICNDAAFALMLAHCAVLRERILRACKIAFGHRLMMDKIIPGGVATDLDPAGKEAISQALGEVRQALPRLVNLYDGTTSLQDRTVGTGILTPALARRFAAGGFVGRASARSFDTRKTLPYPPYDRLDFAVPTLDQGDVDARVWIRIREVEQSLKLIDQLLDLPDGGLLVDLPKGGGEGLALVEGFRGDILVWLRLGPDGRVEHCHLRDPSWFQWPLLEAVIEANIVADFPLCNKSFNCSYSGHDL